MFLATHIRRIQVTAIQIVILFGGPKKIPGGSRHRPKMYSFCHYVYYFLILLKMIKNYYTQSCLNRFFIIFDDLIRSIMNVL